MLKPLKAGSLNAELASALVRKKRARSLLGASTDRASAAGRTSAMASARDRTNLVQKRDRANVAGRTAVSTDQANRAGMRDRQSQMDFMRRQKGGM